MAVITITKRQVKTERNPNPEKIVYKKRAHQKDAEIKYAAAVQKSTTTGEHQIVSHISSVGSGKTGMIIDAIYQGIMNCESRGEKSLSAFVCPTLNLISGQKKAIEDEVKNWIIKDKVEIIEWDCRVDNMDKSKYKTKDFSAKHVIIVVCADSMFGTDAKTGYDRFNTWQAIYKNCEKNGRVGAHIEYDEAHNYGNYQMKMFGRIFN